MWLKKVRKKPVLIAFWLYLLCAEIKQSVAMLPEFTSLWVAAFTCLWPLGCLEVLIPFWSLGLFSYLEIAPVLSLTCSFYSRGARIWVAVVLGSVIMAYIGTGACSRYVWFMVSLSNPASQFQQHVLGVY